MTDYDKIREHVQQKMVLAQACDRPYHPPNYFPKEDNHKDRPNAVSSPVRSAGGRR
jgi:hypothetical protein